MSIAYILQSFDLSTGQRMELPWRFDTPEEAQAKLEELTYPGPEVRYLVKLVPLN
ncbi:MAG TPA: hypothetical protein VJ600_02010 [Holophagaceae bacterium]|nr:hypothetical protein [Holophagaceae bacterium]